MRNFFLHIIIINFYILLMNHSSVACDVHTQSNYGVVRVSQMSMVLDIHMDDMNFEGYVDLTLERIKEGNELILDAMGLVIKDAWMTADPDARNFRSTTWKLGDITSPRLTISLGDDTVLVRVMYSAAEKSLDKHWLPASASHDTTAARGDTEFRPLYARAFVPCQDTNTNEITFNADIKLLSLNPDPRMTLCMLGREGQKLGYRHYQFSVANKIPSNLLTLSAGYMEKNPD